MVTAITMTYADEAIGVARAAAAVEPARRDLLHRGDRRPAALGPGARRRDRRRRRGHRAAPSPTSWSTAPTRRTSTATLDAGGAWVERIGGVRANASTLSHAELDEATELDRGDLGRARPPSTGVCAVAADLRVRRRLLRHRPRARRRHRRRTRPPARCSCTDVFEPGGPVMTTTLLTRHRLWVDDRGDGPPVLLIAGLGDPAEAWTFQQEGLSSRYRTIAFDNRGVGRSPLPDTPLTVAGMADDAATILDELGIERADIVGFSGGSVTAQELAIRHPERVTSLVLMGTFGKGDRYFNAMVRMVTWMMDVAPDPHAFLEAFYLWIYTVGAHESGFVDQLIEEALAFPHPQSPESMHQQLDAWGNHTTLERLGLVEVPTLVIAGGRDLICPPHLGKAVADAIPGAQFEVWPEAAHQPFQEEPERFNARLEAFWASLER